MHTPVDSRLREEAERYRLRFRCEECVQYAPTVQGCANGYPTEPHRAVDLRLERQILFCKDFELV